MIIHNYSQDQIKNLKCLTALVDETSNMLEKVSDHCFTGHTPWHHCVFSVLRSFLYYSLNVDSYVCIEFVVSV